MASGDAKVARQRVFRYTGGVVLCVSAVVTAVAGTAWYISAGGAVFAGMILIGRRRLLGVGISRSVDEIVCRYIPWCEGNEYFTILLIPLLGAVLLGAAAAPGRPPTRLWLCGIVLVGVGPVAMCSAVRVWRGSILRISATSLTVRSVRSLFKAFGDPTEIRREQVESITADMFPLSGRSKAMQVEIAYRTVNSSDSSDALRTVLLGAQLTIKPANLCNALIAWKAGGDDHPGELLDRVERILRGRGESG
jgi:hypothetical protein